MKEVVEFTTMRPKVFEVDRESMSRRIENLVNNRNGFHTEIECNVLMCFRSLGYCLRNCFDYYTIDGLTKKSCRDYLDKYVREV